MVDFFGFLYVSSHFELKIFLENFWKKNRRTLFECYVMATFSHLVATKMRLGFCLVMAAFSRTAVCNAMVYWKDAGDIWVSH